MPFLKRYKCIQIHMFFINSKLLHSKYFYAHFHWITNFVSTDLSAHQVSSTMCSPGTLAQSSVFWTQKSLILKVSITFIGEVSILNQISVSFLTCWIFQTIYRWKECCVHWTIQTILVRYDIFLSNKSACKSQGSPMQLFL